jgi:hypothetical protein
MNRIYKATIAIALAALATASYAAVRASHTRPGNFAVANTYLPLNATGVTTISFNLTAAGKKVLTYSAECYLPFTFDTWVDLDIIVNGITVAPTVGTIDGFCGANSRYSRHSITVPIQGKAGANTVRILGKLGPSATFATLGDTALVIHD